MNIAPTTVEADATHLALLVELESRSRQAVNAQQLQFTIANETWRLLPYRQAYVWIADVRGVSKLRCVSGLAQLNEDSPFTVWLKRLRQELADDQPRLLGPADVGEGLREGWREWLPPHLLIWPLRAPDQTVLGSVWLALESEPPDAVESPLARLMESYGYCLWALTRVRQTWSQRWQSARRWRWLALAALLIALCIPVRLSVLAPAEIIAMQAQVVASPMDGVVKQFHVKPNQSVSKDQLLFTLDDTTIRNRREVAAKQLAVARADALAATQKAFDSEQSRAELAVLNGRVRERQAELSYLEELLTRVDVRAPKPGIAVFGDINDWLGKPVTTGERVVLIADPGDAGVLVWVPAADAINLAVGARIRTFLHTAPLTPVSATLTETSYQAVVSPEGVASYRVRGVIDEAQDLAKVRIGLRGTAKVEGDRAPVAYYLFRRPMATMRQWLGL